MRLKGLVNLNIDVPPPYEQAQGWLDLFERVNTLFFSDKDKLCASDDNVIFMEGNGCTQNQVGSMKPWNLHGDSWSNWNARMQNIKPRSCFDNDEARSLLILPNVKKGEEVQIIYRLFLVNCYLLHGNIQTIE